MKKTICAGYRVSDTGIVESQLTFGRGMSGIWIPLKPLINRRGSHCRYQVVLYIDGEGCRRYVHHLVLEAFVGPCPDGMEACHNNGNGLDNRLENLRWDTHDNNMYDSIVHKHQVGKLTLEDVVRIKKLLSLGFLQSEIAFEFKVAQSLISRIKNGVRWNHV